MKSNRPVNLDLGQVLAVNLKNPVAIASILHRVSGVVVFLLIPVLLYLLQQSLQSEQSFNELKDGLANCFAWRALVWVALAGLIYHLFAGCKHLLADFGIGETLEYGRLFAVLTIMAAGLFILLAFVWVVV